MEDWGCLRKPTTNTKSVGLLQPFTIVYNLILYRLKSIEFHYILSLCKSLSLQKQSFLDNIIISFESHSNQLTCGTDIVLVWYLTYTIFFVYSCLQAKQFESTGTTDIKFLNVLLVSRSPLFSLNELRSHEIHVHWALHATTGVTNVGAFLSLGT